MNSLWKNTVELPHFPTLSGDLQTDILIIGGGMAGILCAYRLTQAGIPCALVEATRICGGITGDTTAKITAQHGLVYHKLLRTLGAERAKMYLEANRRAVAEYRALCRDIDCDFEERDSFVYSLSDRRKLETELQALERLGYPAKLAENLPLPFPTAGAVCFAGQAQFHPLKFVAVITKDLPIYENTKVQELMPHTARTEHGFIRAQKIIVATHFPLLNKHGSYFLKLYQERSHVLALKNAAAVGGMYVDECKNGLSFRNHGQLLLLGGGSHRTGKRSGGWQELRQLSRKFYPHSREVFHWAAQDCITLDGSAYIGPYSARTDGLYVATGFNKWGMTSAMTAAEILTDLILERKNPYAAAFSPSRSMLHPQLALNAAEAAIHLLTPTTPRCPHLGCALKYNAQEHSWDCPCHGSRFTEEGKLINNPATDDHPIRKKI